MVFQKIHEFIKGPCHLRMLDFSSILLENIIVMCLFFKMAFSVNLASEIGTSIERAKLTLSEICNDKETSRTSKRHSREKTIIEK